MFVDSQFGVYLIGLGAAVGGAASISGLRDARSTHWPEVAGLVEGTSVLQDNDGVRRVEVAVSYWVGGLRYERRETVPLGGLPTPERVARVVARYPVGQALVVRHDPGRPRISRLRPGLRLPVVLTGIAAAGLLALGLSAVNL